MIVEIRSVGGISLYGAKIFPIIPLIMWHCIRWNAILNFIENLHGLTREYHMNIENVLTLMASYLLDFIKMWLFSRLEIRLQSFGRASAVRLSSVGRSNVSNSGLISQEQ